MEKNVSLLSHSLSSGPLYKLLGGGEMVHTACELQFNHPVIESKLHFYPWFSPENI